MKWLPVLLSLLLFSCAARNEAHTQQPSNSFLTTSDGKRLSLRHWNLQAKPKTVFIGLHGIEGAARDFNLLGKALPKHASTTTLYALNLRGGGHDSSPKGRGDIRSEELWQRDLLELHRSLRQRHPQARFLWIGESMGSLIVLHTAAQSGTQPDGLILVSPVVSLDTIPNWQVHTLRTAAFLAPGARLSLETLAGGSFQATTNSNHFTQSETNPYHIDKYTLRYLRTLATLSEAMPVNALRAKAPVLILHGSKDFLIKPRQIHEFANTFPNPARVHKFESSHHLLFYDKQREAVVSSILNWAERLPTH